MKYTIGLAIAGAAVLYLFGAFCAASFDISTWDMVLRIFFALFMLVAAALGGMAGFALDVEKGTL